MMVDDAGFDIAWFAASFIQLLYITLTINDRITHGGAD